ncbi:MAG: hypothetical protein IJX62_09630 [Clostridia bacterium]|nr:hypothetical protein [Clostridia bacterium]
MGDQPSNGTFLQNLVELPLLLLTGGVLYYGLEIVYRGHSHWSMALCGGLCFWWLYGMNRALSHLPLLLRALLSALLITAVELLAGCVLNLWLGMSVWDYRKMPLQLWGQICLPFSLLWFLLSIPVCLLSSWIRQRIFLEHE